jgi:predicted Zn-dependent protease
MHDSSRPLAVRLYSKHLRGERVIKVMNIRFCALLLAPLSAISAEGDYASLAIDEDEYRALIESSNELEQYFENQSVIYKDDAIVSMVREIGRTLAPSPLDDYISYEFFVLREPSPNAFALPNGHVYVTTGMLARLEDEAQLAAVLSHEINHVAGHHSILNDRSTTKKLVAATVIGGISGFGDAGSAWAQLIAGVIQQSLIASIYGFSRDLEQEADDRAVLLLLDSPYDPTAMPEVLAILRQDYEGLNPRVPTTWNTHPEIDARIGLAYARAANLPSRERDSDALQVAVRRLREITIEDYAQDGYPQTAVALAQSFVERYPGDPHARMLLADAWQAMGAQAQIDPEHWTEQDKRRNLRDRRRRTREQRLERLLETEEGKAAYAANLARAEETYRKVLDLDASYAPALRGLGEVHEKRGEYREAAEAYLQYVKATPDANDRDIVIDRLRALTERLKNSK